jgi:indolepyruvate decarboxylase
VPRQDYDEQTIGGYLIKRLQDYGIEHVFGIPGDFVLQFYSMLEDSPIEMVGCTREDNAGFAADAYARVHGMGAVCVTFSVGGLSMCNSIAGAYAEKSPVVVISGAPGVDERRDDPLLHHRVRDFNTQREVFEKITVASASLDDPLTAFREIDRCLAACERYKRPVYLELPRDRVRTKSLHPVQTREEKPVSDKLALREAVDEAAAMINACHKPMIIAGVEMHRFGLGDEVVKLAEKHQIPMCATLLGKSVVSEKHPLYLGIYEGAIVKARAVVAAGTVLTGSTPVYDLVRGEIIRPAADRPLVIPPGAVVVPGARAVTSGKGVEWGLSLATPVIVKYRDSRTDTRTELEAWIR